MENIKGKLKKIYEFNDYAVVESIIEDLIICLFSIMIVERFLWSTKFQIIWATGIHTKFNYLMIGLIIAKLSVAKPEKLRIVWLVVALTLFFLISKTENGYGVLLDLVIPMVALYNIDFKKILKAFIMSIGIALLITIVASLLGIIENLIYTWPADRRRRICFGVIYATDFAAYVFFLALAWVAYRGRLVTYIELGVIGLLGVAVYYFCDARLDAICLILIVAVFVFIKLCEKHAVKKKLQTVFPNWFLKICSWAIPLCVVCIFALTVLYFFSPDNFIAAKVNSMLSGRLNYGARAIDEYGFDFWGQQITMYGNGGTTAYYLQEDRFYLDSSYISVFFRFGVLVFVGILMLFWVPAIKACKKGNYILVAIIAILAIQCTVEHHLLDMNYNPFIFMLLAKNTYDMDNKLELSV